MLWDIFISLCKNVNWDIVEVRQMETVGYVHGGLVLMIIVLDVPAGYVTRIRKSSLYRIPEEVESFDTALDLLGAVWASNVPDISLRIFGLRRPPFQLPFVW
ncbi:hypothetical protein G9A89_013206 [Geosiphon pyriformis]|nr:hypothetical protein G9A89_013206 [Geosiphon pyriformis]